MNAAAHPDDELSDDERRTRRLRFELIFGSLWLAFGLFVLPALIYWVGAAALGPYGENKGLSTFYSDYFGDLADGAGRAWTLALGPIVLMYLLRAIFIGVTPGKVERASVDLDEDEPPPPPRRAPVQKEIKRPAGRPARVEPRMGGD